MSILLCFSGIWLLFLVLLYFWCSLVKQLTLKTAEEEEEEVEVESEEEIKVGSEEEAEEA